MLRRRLSAVLAGCALLALWVTVAPAQEGHPLTGSWHGDWGADAKSRTSIVVFMKWNNTAMEGTLNPGRNGVPLKSATLDPAKWTVHLEAETKDGQRVVADGKLEDIGSYHRTISGTWTQGPAKGDFKLRRD